MTHSEVYKFAELVHNSEPIYHAWMLSQSQPVPNETLGTLSSTFLGVVSDSQSQSVTPKYCLQVVPTKRLYKVKPTKIQAQFGSLIQTITLQDHLRFVPNIRISEYLSFSVTLEYCLQATDIERLHMLKPANLQASLTIWQICYSAMLPKSNVRCMGAHNTIS